MGRNLSKSLLGPLGSCALTPQAGQRWPCRTLDLRAAPCPRDESRSQQPRRQSRVRRLLWVPPAAPQPSLGHRRPAGPLQGGRLQPLCQPATWARPGSSRASTGVAPTLAAASPAGAQGLGGCWPDEPWTSGELPDPAEGPGVPSPQAQNPSWEAGSPKRPGYLLLRQNSQRQDHPGVYEVEGEHRRTTGPTRKPPAASDTAEDARRAGAPARRGVASSARRAPMRAPDTPTFLTVQQLPCAGRVGGPFLGEGEGEGEGEGTDTQLPASSGDVPVPAYWRQLRARAGLRAFYPRPLI